MLFAPYQCTPAVAAASADQREWLRQAVAALYASDGGWADGSGVDPPGGAAVPRAAVATTSAGVRKREQGRERRVAMSGRGVSASARPALRASPGVKGLLGGHESPLV